MFSCFNDAESCEGLCKASESSLSSSVLTMRDWEEHWTRWWSWAHTPLPLSEPPISINKIGGWDYRMSIVQHFSDSENGRVIQWNSAMDIMQASSSFSAHRYRVNFLACSENVKSASLAPSLLPPSPACTHLTRLKRAFSWGGRLLGIALFPDAARVEG